MKALNASASQFFEGAMSKYKVVRTVKAAKGTSRMNSVRLDVPITANSIAERETEFVILFGAELKTSTVITRHTPMLEKLKGTCRLTPSSKALHELTQIKSVETSYLDFFPIRHICNG